MSQINRFIRFVHERFTTAEPLSLSPQKTQSLQKELGWLKKEIDPLEFTFPLYEPFQEGILKVVNPENSSKGGLFGWVRNAGTKIHSGIDIQASQGSPVLAAEEGVVTFAGELRGYGNVIYINHPGGYQTRYAHLQENSLRVKVGQPVLRGQKIGASGKTGNANRPGIIPHLHFEIRKIKKETPTGSIANEESQAIDPIPFLLHSRNSKFALEYHDKGHIEAWNILNQRKFK